MILNLRGSSCSGKSTPVYRLLAEYPSVEVIEREAWNKKKPRLVGHVLPGGLFIAGPYASHAKTGGMDMLQPGQTELVTIWLERHLHRYPFVIFESLMASLAMGRYFDLHDRVTAANGRDRPFAFAFLDTPLETCRQRLLTRSGGTRSNGEPLNLAATCDHSWARMRTIRQRFIDDGRFLVYDLDHTRTYEQVLGLLTQAGWEPYGQPPPALYVEPEELTLAGIIRELRRDEGWPDDPKRRQQLLKELPKFEDRVL